MSLHVISYEYDADKKEDVEVPFYSIDVWDWDFKVASAWCRSAEDNAAVLMSPIEDEVAPSTWVFYFSNRAQAESLVDMLAKEKGSSKGVGYTAEQIRQRHCHLV